MMRRCKCGHTIKQHEKTGCKKCDCKHFKYMEHAEKEENLRNEWIYKE